MRCAASELTDPFDKVRRTPGIAGLDRRSVLINWMRYRLLAFARIPSLGRQTRFGHRRRTSCTDDDVPSTHILHGQAGVHSRRRTPGAVLPEELVRSRPRWCLRLPPDGMLLLLGVNCTALGFGANDFGSCSRPSRARINACPGVAARSRAMFASAMCPRASLPEAICVPLKAGICIAETLKRIIAGAGHQRNADSLKHQVRRPSRQTAGCRLSLQRIGSCRKAPYHSILSKLGP